MLHTIVIIIKIALMISLVGIIAFGVWDLYLALANRHFELKLSHKKRRNFKNLYILVPALNEATVIKQTVLALLSALKSLPLRTILIVINDASTDDTGQILKTISKPNFKVLTRKLPDGQKGKGMALNCGLEYIQKVETDSAHTLIGVVDADSQPDSQLFKDVLQAFNYSNYDLVQTGISINGPYRLLVLLQAIEFEVTNYLTQLLRVNWGSALASGNGQFMTMKMATTIRWGDCLIEDLEFSLKGLLEGYQGLFLPETLMPQKGLTKIRPLIKQRVRWCQGGLQCLIRYIKPIIRSKKVPRALKLDITIFLCQPFLSMGLYICAATSVITMTLLAFKAPAFTMTLLISLFIISTFIELAMISTTYITNPGFKTQFTKRQLLLAVVTNIWYLIILIPVPYIVLYRHLTQQTNWAKTKH